MDPRSKSAMVAITAAMAVASPAAAQQADGRHDVAVALVDVGANALYSKDPNVRFVDLTPPLKDGFHHASGRIGKMDHGDIVAQSFVEEYRRLDPDARITFYTVNPFIQKGITGPMMFSRSMLQQALPKLKETNVRVAITTFGVSDEASGDRILKDFQDAGLIVFAATPNRKDDEGIWPAASPSVIAVGDAVTPDSGFMKSRKWSSWVDFAGNGSFHSGDIDTDGSSFATPRVAAYGAYLALAKPDIQVEEMKVVLTRTSVSVRIHDRDFARIGGDRTASQMKQQVAALRGDIAIASTTAKTTPPIAVLAARRMAIAGAMNR